MRSHTFKPVVLFLMSLFCVTLLAEDFSAWQHSADIIMNTKDLKKTDLSGDLKNVPVLIRLKSNVFTFTEAKTDGADIRFATAGGTTLPYYIASWDAVKGEAEVWVNMPTITVNKEDNKITMYWGNAGATSTADEKAVFEVNHDLMGAVNIKDIEGLDEKIKEKNFHIFNKIKKEDKDLFNVKTRWLE